jgi:hypothetical protein
MILCSDLLSLPFPWHKSFFVAISEAIQACLEIIDALRSYYDCPFFFGKLSFFAVADAFQAGL